MRQESGQRLCEDLRWPIHFVWVWRWRGSIIHELILRRKGAQILKAENALALLSLASLPTDIRQKIDGIYYPSLWQGRKDHTYFLAQAVSQILGVDAYGVVIPEVSQYKTCGRQKRLKLRVAASDHQVQYIGSYPLFVDDVITTGATMEAVWRVLGRPDTLRGLCLAYKTFNPEDKV